MFWLSSCHDDTNKIEMVWGEEGGEKRIPLKDPEFCCPLRIFSLVGQVSWSLTEKFGLAACLLHFELWKLINPMT